MKARIARICTSFIDVPDKIAVAIYFSGCSIRCPECQNKELWDFENGTVMTIEDVLVKIAKHPIAESVVFLGGEPTDQMDFLIELNKRINKFSMLYTGREMEDMPEELLDNLNMLVCGPYRSEFHVGGFPASSNQRFFKKGEKQWICQKCH